MRREIVAVPFIYNSFFFRYRLRRLVCFAGVTILGSIIVTACLAAKDDSLPLSGSFLRLNL